MELAQAVRALVDAQCPGWGEERRAERVGTILHNQLCYLGSDGVLCVRADQHSTLNSMLALGHELTTRVSPGALATLEHLRELRDRGVLSASMITEGNIESEAE